jgi:hypothetical protein
MNGNMQELEMRSQMKMQLDIIKQCFGDCITNFSAGELSSNEKSCVQNCGKRQIQAMMMLGEA